MLVKIDMFVLLRRRSFSCRSKKKTIKGLSMLFMVNGYEDRNGKKDGENS
jgi:hypothetical protein